MTKLLETPPVPLSFTFDKDATLTTVLYLVGELGQPSRQTVFNLLYLADKKHLEDYGRFISTDTYYALTQGPVPGHVYNVLNSLEKQGEYLSLDKEFKQAFAASLHTIEGHRLEVAITPDLENLSESDIKCLNLVLETYSKLSSQELEQLCQDAAWKATVRNQEISLEAIVRTLPNSEDLIEYLRDPFPGDL
jgi:uncharacterized phage-associated protein